MPRGIQPQAQVNIPQNNEEEMEEINQLVQQQPIRQQAPQQQPKQTKERYSIGQYAKETEDVVVDNETGNAYRVIDAVAMILNIVSRTDKKL